MFPQLIEEDVVNVRRVLRDFLEKSEADFSLVTAEGGFVMFEEVRTRAPNTAILGALSSGAFDASQKIAEVLDKWTSRDGRSPAPASWEVFLAQESRYDSDLNDGVRVNLAPIQRAGLLAADVLSAKAVEKALADRAEWRADERRWCREGKLPRPGWWPEGAADVRASTAASTRRSGRR